jgi:crossover junction endodeoxyribonuclease RusA
MELVLPYPPSVNHYWRHFKGRTLISREGRAYRQQVMTQCRGFGGQPPRDGRLALAMDAFPPDRRRRDLDNIQKSALDSMQHAGIYEDDSLIDLLVTRRRMPIPSGQVVVRIDAMPLRVCPLCQHSLPEGFSN